MSSFKFNYNSTTADLDDYYVRAYWFSLNRGNLWGTGMNSTYAQLGDNTIADKSSPVQTVTFDTIWKQVTGGYLHTVALKLDGTLWSWGNNSQGQLGDNTIVHRSSPVQTVAFGTNWSKISSQHGGRFSAGIKEDGTLWMWGYNSNGQLGDNTTIAKSSPVQTVTGGTTWSSVACGSEYTAATKSDGTLWTWGRNSYGQLGDNTTIHRSSPVQTIAGGTSWSSVACGSSSCYGIKNDRTLWGWGENTYGQLGDNTKTHRSSPIQTIARGSNWLSVSAFTRHTGAIKNDGTLWMWGRNAVGQLGDNTGIDKSSPVQTISYGNSWSKIAVGGGGPSIDVDGHTAAIKSDGSLWTWGKNYYGQLGDNKTASKSSPAQTVMGKAWWRAVNCGQRTTHGITFLTVLQVPVAPPSPTPSPVAPPASPPVAPPPTSPPTSPSPGPGPAPCWVARMVYGETNPKWVIFRDWLFSEGPTWLQSVYMQHGERFAEFIENRPVFKFVIRSTMNVIIRNKKPNSNYIAEQIKEFKITKGS